MFSRCTSIFALVFCVFLGACGRPDVPAAATPDAEFVTAVNQAVAHMGRYDFAAAVTAFAALQKAHPDSAEVVLNLALAMTNRQAEGDAAAAERLLRTVLHQPVVTTRAQYALGLLLLYGGRDAEALPLFQAVTSARPDDAFPAYFAGQGQLNGSPSEALEWFEKARRINPLLRSAHYGAFQALQRLGRPEEAATRLTEFQALEANPRATVAEFKYTRMGPLAQVVTVDGPSAAATLPAGPVFGEARAIALSANVRWAPADGASITVADINGDGMVDLFLAAAAAGTTPNAVLLGNPSGWTLDPSHPLAAVRGVRAALWGDIDNDGLIDAVLVSERGRSTVWHQDASHRWRDVTSASRAATPGVDGVDGALFDADHDGDLDVFLVNAGGPNELLNNNGDGTFRSIAQAAGLAGDRRPSRGVAVADLDGDRDEDLIILKATPPHEVFLNDRVWQYRAAPGTDAFAAGDFAAVLPADLDADGAVELYTDGARGLERWTKTPDGAWAPRRLSEPSQGPRHRLAVADVQGDGALELVVSRASGWIALSTSDVPRVVFDASRVDAPAWTVATVDAGRGPDVVGLGPTGPLHWNAGTGRFAYVGLAPTGRDRKSDQLRSNVSGIGTAVSVRTGSRWSAFDTARLQSGPGQSLQPMSIGLGGASKTDFVSLTWSDGVMQTEVGLEAGRVHRIEETQRQLSSCPVLFAFNGTSMAFVTDILGVGGVGFFESPGTYSAPFPKEAVLLPLGAIAPVDGVYRLVIGEPMEEITYLDHASLDSYDLPPGWQMTLDERKALADPQPTGAPIFFREERLPTRVVNDRGADVTELTAMADLRAAPPGTPDPRYIGMTASHSLELTFAAPIDRGPGRPVLMIDGWIEYPYAQTVFAAWQAKAAFTAPTLEARDASGRWQVVAPEFGYPAGMPRRMTLPLPDLPRETTALRLRTSQEIYWDRLAVVYSEAAPDVSVSTAPLRSATLRDAGFATRTTGPQRTPSYDYGRRVPLFDTRHPRGWYTRFGPVDALVSATDHAVAVFGPGEDLELAFEAPATPPRAGWTRRVVLRTTGWCKDMDLYTLDGETVAPLPGTDTPARQRLHAEFNTRYDAGR